MTGPAPVLRRIEAFDRKNGGVTVAGIQGGYTLTLTATQAPIARLGPEGSGDGARLYYWSWRNHWIDVGEIGGLVLPLDDAFDEIPSTDIFWKWT